MGRKNKRIKRAFQRLFSIAPHMKYLYGYFYKYCKVDANTILIESFHGKTIGDSGLVFAQELIKSYPDRFQIYFATTDKKKHQKLIKELGLDVKLVVINSLKYAKLLATAKYIISNASLPIYFVKKDDQKYMQTWHGTPFKTLGKQMRMGLESLYNVQHNFLQADYITFPNQFTRDALMKDYNLEALYTGKVVMCGYPRNQIFLQESAADSTRKKYGLEGKTVYAYMPTWRGADNQSIDSTDYTNELYSILLELDKRMKDDQLFFINFHPIIKNSISYKRFRHIKPFPDGVDTYTFLNSADVLVTDYSSVFFDFSLSKKPIVLFMYDYEEYMKERGSYMNIKDLPFRQIFDREEFVKCIEGNECLEDSYEGTDYFRTFFKYDSKDNAKKLLGLMIDGDASDLVIDNYRYNSEKKMNVYLPDKVVAESDLRTLAEVASGDNDVVWLYRKWFPRTDMGMILHDKYNDAFNYIITANAPPRTYLEQVMRKLGNKKVEERILKRDVKRCLPGLNVSFDFITDFGCIRDGYKVKWSDIIRVDSEITNNADGTMEIKYEAPHSLNLESLAILDYRDAIVYRRALHEDEINDSRVIVDFRTVIENLSLYEKESGTPGLIATNSNGEKRFIGFTNTKKASSFNKNPNKIKKVDRFFTPVTGSFSLPMDYYRTNLRIIHNSFDERVSSTISGYVLDREQKSVSLLPFLSDKGDRNILQVTVAAPENAIKYISERAVFKGCRFASDRMEVKAFLPGWSSEHIRGGLLKFNSPTVDLTIPVNAEVIDNNKGCLVKLTLNYNDRLPLEPLRWFCFVNVLVGESEHRLSIKCSNPLRKIRFYLWNIQSDIGDGNILFPYLSRGGDIFNVAYRGKTEYDNTKTRIKELFALILFRVLYPFKNYFSKYIVYEKFCKTAQDNSFYFFKYCMENLPSKEKNKFYYIIDKRSKEYDNVKEYEPRIIQFMSIKHMVYAMLAKICISTDSSTHLYAWQSRPSWVFNRVHQQKVLFLQHGVTALKRVDQLFGKKGSSPMKYFVTTSPVEQQIVIQNFGYKKADAPMVGFTRWDVLEDKKSDSAPFILIMPTWRIWLENVDEEGFINSDYYQNYKALLTDRSFSRLLEENNISVILYLHPKFASHIESFRSSISTNIKCVAFGEEPLNEIMMRCHMLVTDYSSVCWDVLFMDKPVLFYQFDYERYMQAHGSYIDMTKDLPSPRTTDKDELVDLIREHIESGFKINEKYESVMDDFFAFKDHFNSARTYKFLLDREERGLK